MTALERINQLLDELKRAPASDIGRVFPAVSRRFRLLPNAERTECTNALQVWARLNAGRQPLKACYLDFLQGVHLFISEEHEAALHWLTGVRKRFEEMGDPEGLGMASMLIGATYRTLRNFDLALKVTWEGYELLKTSGRYPVFVSAAANSMANINFDMHNYDEALAMFTVAYDESAKANDYYFNIYALHGLGRVYLYLKRQAEARDAFTRALQSAEANESPLHIANSMSELAGLESASGDNARAEELNQQALAIRERHHLTGGAITSCINLGDLYAKKARWDEALAVLNKGLALAEQSRVKPKQYQVHQMLSNVYERMHDLERSLLHFKRFHELREQVEVEDSARKLSDAKLIFEAEQTRKESVIIRQQKDEIHAKNITLQETLDELTLARISKKARALTLGLFVILFIFQNAIMGFALGLLSSDSYWLSLLVKMGIILSLSPVNQAIERYLLRKMIRSRRSAATALPAPQAAGDS